MPRAPMRAGCIHAKQRKQHYEIMTNCEVEYEMNT